MGLCALVSLFCHFPLPSRNARLVNANDQSWYSHMQGVLRMRRRDIDVMEECEPKTVMNNSQSVEPDLAVAQ
jgi:hypothetical protein